MLQQLHVKNLALIDEADITFQRGLNIFTGETGAGKSLLLGSVNLALGAKASKDLIRNEKDYALVELLFHVEGAAKDSLKELGVFMEEEGQVLISRKLMEGRSISKVNGEMVSLSELRNITGILLDIHGQHEHQSLLYPANHLKILDEFSREQEKESKEELKIAWEQYREAKKACEEFVLEEEQRVREIAFLEFEVAQIEEADIKEGEKEQLSSWYKKASNSKKIMEVVSCVHEELANDSLDGAGRKLGRAVKELSTIAEYDEEVNAIKEQAENIDALLSDMLREISSYMTSLEFDEQQFYDTQSRLDVIHNLEYKYGESFLAIHTYLTEKRERLTLLQQYEIKKEEAQKKLHACEERLHSCCKRLSDIRKKTAKILQKRIVDALLELNFLDVQFEVHVEPSKQISQSGYDTVEFLISTNPGEPVKPLAKIASGGELSRIMLAIKTILSDQDKVETLLFDEIDTGISGRTAQKVSEKLKEISKHRQVLCITHLPQIAAMAEEHFLIEKSVKENRTMTIIKALGEEESIAELARMLGGTELTQAVYQNAGEMKRFAKK